MTLALYRTLYTISSVMIGAMLCISTVADAGPVAGQRQLPAATESSSNAAGPSTTTQENNDAVSPSQSNQLISSYIGALKRHVLPDINSTSIDDTGQVNLDSLQGWSLDDIKAAMDAAALGLDDPNAGQSISDIRQAPLTVSVQDLYNFNTGYYFVLNGEEQNNNGELLSGPNLPEIIGQTALSEIELDIVNLSETGINLGIETSLGMLDESFFTSTNSSSAGNRTIGGRGFRGGIGERSVGRVQGFRSDSNSSTRNVTDFIIMSLDFVRDNLISITLAILGISGIGYITSRFA